MYRKKKPAIYDKIELKAMRFKYGDIEPTWELLVAAVRKLGEKE